MILFYKDYIAMRLHFFAIAESDLKSVNKYPVIHWYSVQPSIPSFGEIGGLEDLLSYPVKYFQGEVIDSSSVQVDHCIVATAAWLQSCRQEPGVNVLNGHGGGI